MDGLNGVCGKVDRLAAANDKVDVGVVNPCKPQETSVFVSCAGASSETSSPHLLCTDYTGAHTSNSPPSRPFHITPPPPATTTHLMAGLLLLLELTHKAVCCEVALSRECRHAATACCGDGLAPLGVVQVTSRIHTRQAGRHAMAHLQHATTGSTNTSQRTTSVSGVVYEAECRGSNWSCAAVLSDILLLDV